MKFIFSKEYSICLHQKTEVNIIHISNLIDIGQNENAPYAGDIVEVNDMFEFPYSRKIKKKGSKGMINLNYMDKHHNLETRMRPKSFRPGSKSKLSFTKK